MKITSYSRQYSVDLSSGPGVLVNQYARTALGSNTPLVESGAGSPGSGPQAAAWDHVHPAAAGGSSSFGSNSTRVAKTPSAGASSSNSRADHVHDGIGGATASGSNTLNTGNLNLRAGTGIALALSNTDGGTGFDTVTIQNIAAGGSGSVSYGSNSTRVSSSPAGGASTLVSRADHVHDGVRSIAKAGSSALFGDVTLTGGTNVTLTQSGNDISIAASGSGSGALTFIASATVAAGGATTLTITGIPNTYKDLVLVCRVKLESNSNGEGASLRVGSGSIDTGSNYQYISWWTGWTAGSGSGTDRMGFCIGARGDTGTGRFATGSGELVNYASTSLSKGWVARSFSHDNAGYLIANHGGEWKTTGSAVDQVQLIASTGDLNEGTTLWVYGRG